MPGTGHALGTICSITGWILWVGACCFGFPARSWARSSISDCTGSSFVGLQTSEGQFWRYINVWNSIGQRQCQQDGFVPYEFENSTVFHLQKKVLLDSKRSHGASVTSTSFHMLEIPIVHQTVVSWVIPESVPGDFDEYAGVNSDPIEAGGERSGNCLSL